MTAFKQKGLKRDRCKDVFAYKELESGTIVLLSDGVSSKRYSDIGADYVQQKILKVFNDIDINNISEHEIKEIIIKTIVVTIFQLSQKLNCSFSEFASTLLMIIAPNMREYYYTVHVGDGMIGVVKDDNSIIILSSPENGLTKQYTYTTASHKLAKHLRVAKHYNLGNIFMMTDGLANEVCDNFSKYKTILCKRRWNDLEKMYMKNKIEDDIGFCEMCII